MRSPERKEMKVTIHFMDSFIQCFKDVKAKYVENNLFFIELEETTLMFPLFNIRSVES